MANQEQTRDGIPRKDAGRPSPDVDGAAPADGQAAGAQPARQRPQASERGDEARSGRFEGDGPQKMGLTSDDQPDLVAPSGVNERDHGAAGDKPMGGGSLNFDDDDMAHPRGRSTAAGGTWAAQGGDSGSLKPPAEILSDRNGPSDPDGRKEKPKA